MECSLWQYKVYARIRWDQMRVLVENGDFHFFRSLCVYPSEHFTYMATRQPLRDASVDDLGHISRSLDCFTSNFSRTVCDTAKVTIKYKLLIGNHTLAFNWRHFR